LPSGGFLTKKMTHHLATIDERYPITRALEYGFKNGMFVTTTESQLRTQMEDLVIESAEKFVGFKNTDSLRKAFDMVLGIVSLALMHATSGKENRMEWAHLINKGGLKSILNDVLVLIKTLTQKPEGLVLPDHECFFVGSARDMLVAYATSIDDKKKQWNGYKKLCESIESHKQALNTSMLAQWLITHLALVPVARWVNINGDDSDLPTASEIVNTLLFRHCCGLSTRGKCVLKVKDFLSTYNMYAQNQQKWAERTRARYNSLVEQIPDDIRCALIWNRNDWYTRFLKDGPPGVTEDTRVLDNLEGPFFGYHVLNWA
jgi:hypothetical protein